MAPTHVHQYKPRDVSRSAAFTLLFGSIALFVVASVTIWAFVVPHLRKKYFPLKPSRTKYNQHLFVSSGRLPLIQPRYRHRERRADRNSQSWPRNVSLYDPRTQTPFPNLPSGSRSPATQTWTPARVSSSNMDPSQSLFTPVRDGNTACLDQTTSRAYTLPIVRPQSQQAASVVDRDFGDAREYILAVPEPLHLRSRTHTEMTPSSTLRTMPESGQLSSSTDKHLHPNKLFEQLKTQQPRNSECSSTSLRISDPPKQEFLYSIDATEDANAENEGDTSPTISEQLDEREVSMLQSEEDNIAVAKTSSVMAEEDSELSAYNASVTAMHRLCTYRSLVGAPPPEPLSRAGTLTRPKTPVAIIRDMYNKKTRKPQATKNTVNRNDTISTLFRSMADSSDHRSSQSSATSPLKGSPEPFAASSLSLLPTPLKIQRFPDTRSISTPVRRGSKFKEELNHEERTVSQPIRGGRDVSKEKEDSQIEVPYVRITTSRPKPPPLTFDKNAHLPPRAKNLTHTNPSVNTERKPFKRPHVASMQASSVYSRDTRGVSVTYTPVTPEFAIPEYANPEFAIPSTFHPSFSPHLPSTIGDNTDSDQATEANLIKAKNSPAVDSAKEKVENWDVDTSEITFDTSPSSSLKRALSTFGPECQSTVKTFGSDNDEEEDDDDQHSIISTEIHPSEARLSCVIGSPLRVSGHTEIGVARESIPAPGNADWV